MTLGAAMHRTSLEVLNGDPIDNRPDYLRRSGEAECGSLALLNALREQFLFFAMTYGVTLRDAELFCMNAEEPQ
jgi:hypothetical protein